MTIYLAVGEAAAAPLSPEEVQVGGVLYVDDIRNAETLPAPPGEPAIEPTAHPALCAAETLPEFPPTTAIDRGRIGWFRFTLLAFVL
jgi:hypothetical protein